MKRRLHPWLGVKRINPHIRHWQYWAKYAQWCPPIRVRKGRRRIQQVEIDDNDVNITEGIIVTNPFWDKDFGRKKRPHIKLPLWIRMRNAYQYFNM